MSAPCYTRTRRLRCPAARAQLLARIRPALRDGGLHAARRGDRGAPTHILALPNEEIESLAFAAPAMTGAEYLTARVLFGGNAQAG
jgi:hypothetical protein